jgi:hypothetical protein
VMWGARNRVRTRHSHLVAVLGVSVMAEFACWPAGALGDSALSTPISKSLSPSLLRIRPTALAWGLTSGFTSPQVFGLAFFEPCRIPRKTPWALAPMGGVHAALATEARLASRWRPAHSSSSFSLIRVSSSTPTLCFPIVVHRSIEA